MATIISNDPRGVVYTYHWDGTALTPANTLQGNNTHSKAFGASLDMKGDYLIVGSPDEDNGIDIVGAAYTFDYNGTNWNEYPGIHSRIKDTTGSTKYLGTKVAINTDGNVSMLSDSGGSSYIYTSDGTQWSQSYDKSYQNGGAVDMDDGVYLMAQRAARFNFFNKTDGTSRVITFTRTGSSLDYTSATLYKEQLIFNVPSNTEAAITSVPCGIKPTYLKAYEWAMVAVPCGDGSATPADIFGDDIGGIYETDWIMYEQNDTKVPSSGGSTPKVITDINQSMKLGVSYWIISATDKTLKADDNAISTYTALDLNKINPDKDNVGGYYYYHLPDTLTGIEQKIMIGNPMPRPFKWVHLRVKGPASEEPIGAVGIYSDTGYVYDTTQTGQPYRAITYHGTPGVSDEVRPYEGVWIKQNTTTQNIQGLELAIPFEK